MGGAEVKGLVMVSPSKGMPTIAASTPVSSSGFLASGSSIKGDIVVIYRQFESLPTAAFLCRENHGVFKGIFDVLHLLVADKIVVFQRKNLLSKCKNVLLFLGF